MPGIGCSQSIFVVKQAVAPQVGKVIQTLLKLSEETDLDILNSCMETMVDHYQAELLPVAAELTARLVRRLHTVCKLPLTVSISSARHTLVLQRKASHLKRLTEVTLTLID